MARSAGVMTSFLTSSMPDVASVAGVLHIAGKLTTAEAAGLAPAAREGAAYFLRSTPPAVKSEAASAKVAVLTHKPIFDLLTEGQQVILRQAARERAAEVQPQRLKIRKILDGIVDRLDWGPVGDPATLAVHLPDGSVYHRTRPSGLTKPAPKLPPYNPYDGPRPGGPQGLPPK